MKNGKITITGSTVHIEPGPDGQVWMSRWQLAELFGVYIQAITANVRAIIKSGVVKPSMDCPVIMSGNMPLPELCNMDIIVALAFRIDSRNAEILRRWIIRKALTDRNRLHPTIFIRYGDVGAAN